MIDRPLRIEPDGSHDSGVCPCCGEQSRRVWGTVFADDCVAAVYYVHWTRNRVTDHGANFDLLVGDWGEDATPSARALVAVAYRLIDGRPQFMVVDAAERLLAEYKTLASTALRRDEVVGMELARVVFGMLDAIWLGDGRVAELHGRS